MLSLCSFGLHSHVLSCASNSPVIRSLNYVARCLGWIASKVKAVTPALPAAEATTPIAVVNNAEANSAAGSASGNAGRKGTKARKKKKPKTTKAVSTTTPTNNDGGRSPDGDDNDEEEEDAKPSGRRNRRALLHF